MPIEVSLAPCQSYEREEAEAALKEVLAPLGGLDWVTPGMRIAIKANLVASRKPEMAATTHPVLMAALTRMLIERGASVVLGDSPGGLYNAAYVGRIYNTTGMKLVEEAGARLNDDYSEADRDFPEGAIARKIRYTAYLDQADAIIDFCKLKTHAMMGMSAAAKNMFGVIPGTVKPEYHYRYPDTMNFARMIIDLDRCFPPRLCIVDGVIGMEGNGPTAGTPRKIGLLLASTDPHKLDLVCAKVIGLTKEDVPTLLAAHEVGLIPDTAEDVETNISPDDYVIPDYNNIGSALSGDGNEALWGKTLSAFMQRAIASRPQIHPKECIGCRECEKICPAKAIVMRSKKPVIDRKKCIHCFCCQEFCPKGAMKSRRPLIARILDHK